MRETELTRSDEPAADDKGAPKGASKLLGKLGKIGKLAKKGAKLLPRAGAAAEVDLPAGWWPTISSR